MVVWAEAERKMGADRRRDANHSLGGCAGRYSALEARDVALTHTGELGQPALTQTRLVAPISEPRTDDHHFGHRPLRVQPITWVTSPWSFVHAHHESSRGLSVGYRPLARQFTTARLVAQPIESTNRLAGRLAHLALSAALVDKPTREKVGVRRACAAPNSGSQFGGEIAKRRDVAVELSIGVLD